MLQDRKIVCMQTRPCIFQPGNITGLGSEGLTTTARERESRDIYPTSSPTMPLGLWPQTVETDQKCIHPFTSWLKSISTVVPLHCKFYGCHNYTYQNQQQRKRVAWYLSDKQNNNAIETVSTNRGNRWRMYPSIHRLIQVSLHGRSASW